MKKISLTRKEVKELLVAISQRKDLVTHELMTKVKLLDNKTPCAWDPRNITYWYNQSAGQLNITDKELGALIECLQTQLTSYLLLNRLEEIV